MTDISKYISSLTIHQLDALTRRDALEEMVDYVHQKGKIIHKEEFLQAVLEREKIVSTGIGLGVALPHAKLPSVEDFFVALGVASHGIEWESLDDIPVKLVFLIGGPDDKQTEYLHILSSLTLSINDEEKRKLLLGLTNPEDIAKILAR